MAYVTLSSSLRWDGGQPYGFRRVLVTHIRANMEHSRSESDENGDSYLDDAYDKFGMLLQEQGYFKEAETLRHRVLDMRNRILGVEHTDTIRAMANLAATYQDLGKYTKEEELEIQVLDAGNRFLGVEHPNTIRAMANLATTYHILGKYTEAEMLEMQVLDASSTTFLEWNTQIQSHSWQILQPHANAWENTQCQRSWKHKFWKQGIEFFKWNTQTQSEQWQI